MTPGRLPRKHIVPEQERWLEAWEHARETCPDDVLDGLVDDAIARIRAKCAGLRVGIAYSGGKDSIVATWLMERSGIPIHGGVFGTPFRLSYHSMMRWVFDHMPSYVEAVDTGQDFEWLRAHPGMLFPDLAGRTRWADITHNAAQRSVFASRRLDIMVLGRRLIDGNWTGPGHDYVTRGVRRWSVIAEWPHEAVFALLQREGLGLPPCYHGPTGFRAGSMVAWPRRGPWSLIWSLEPDRVREAAKHRVPGAADFLLTV